jgi:hypothetical protein
MDRRDRIKHGPDRSKSSPKIGKNPKSAFTPIKKTNLIKLPSLKKNCSIC